MSEHYYQTKITNDKFIPKSGDLPYQVMITIDLPEEGQTEEVILTNAANAIRYYVKNGELPTWTRGILLS